MSVRPPDLHPSLTAAARTGRWQPWIYAHALLALGIDPEDPA